MNSNNFTYMYSCRQSETNLSIAIMNGNYVTPFFNAAVPYMHYTDSNFSIFPWFCKCTCSCRLYVQRFNSQYAP